MEATQTDWHFIRHHCPACMKDAYCAVTSRTVLDMEGEPVYSPEEICSLPNSERPDPIATVINHWASISHSLHYFDRLELALWICSSCFSSFITCKEIAPKLPDDSNFPGWPSGDEYISILYLENRYPDWLTTWMKKDAGINLHPSVFLSDAIDDLFGDGTQNKIMGESGVEDETRIALQLYLEAREEVIRAMAANLRILATAGIRTMLDILITVNSGRRHGGLGGSFSERIAGLEDERLITPAELALIRKTLDWGHKASHAAVKPDRDTMKTSFEIVEAIAPKLLLRESLMKAFLSLKPREKKIARAPRYRDDRVIPFPPRE
jgi:hypothetical protein